MPSAQIAAAPSDRVTILVVDDDPLIAMSTVDMLEDLGHAVREASSGVAALEILAEDASIALLITDQIMPEMTGFELARRARERRPDLAVLLATGYGGSSANEAALPRLPKPFQQADLERAIAAVLGGES